MANRAKTRSQIRCISSEQTDKQANRSLKIDCNRLQAKKNAPKKRVSQTQSEDSCQSAKTDCNDGNYHIQFF